MPTHYVKRTILDGKSALVFYNHSFKSDINISENAQLGWLISNSIKLPFYRNEWDKCFHYTLIDNGKIVKYIPQDYKSEFLKEVINMPETGWMKKVTSIESSVPGKYYCTLQLCLNPDLFYKRVINDNLYDIEKLFIYNFLLEKTMFLNKNSFTNDWKGNWVNDNDELSQQPSGFQVKLYEHQLKSLKWMIDIEKNKIKNNFYPYISLKYITKHEKLSKLNFDIFDRSFVLRNHKNHRLISNGGILADEIGLGKTLTSIALIKENPCVIEPNIKLPNFSINLTEDNKLKTCATLIICPGHLTKQWASEIRKNCPDLKTVLILTKTNHKKAKYLNILTVDVVIASLDFFINTNWYLNIEYYMTPENKRTLGMEKVTEARMLTNFDSRMKKIRDEFRYNVSPVCFLPNVHKYLFHNIFRFENMHWYRILIDEGHEIFKIDYVLNTVMKKKYQIKFINSLYSD